MGEESPETCPHILSGDMGDVSCCGAFLLKNGGIENFLRTAAAGPKNLGKIAGKRCNYGNACYNSITEKLRVIP